MLLLPQSLEVAPIQLEGSSRVWQKKVETCDVVRSGSSELLG